MPKSHPNRVLIDSQHREGKRFTRHLAAIGRRCLTQLGLEGCELSISLVTDRRIRRLNKAWREKDRATDVLSFSCGEVPRTPGARKMLGDVVISLDTARRQARPDGIRHELARYLVHGMLHLLGYDHEKRADARRMARREMELLSSPGLIMGDCASLGSADG